MAKVFYLFNILVRISHRLVPSLDFINQDLYTMYSWYTCTCPQMTMFMTKPYFLFQSMVEGVLFLPSINLESRPYDDMCI